jgi:hypothetical protein
MTTIRPEDAQRIDCAGICEPVPPQRSNGARSLLAACSSCDSVRLTLCTWQLARDVEPSRWVLGLSRE